VACIANHCIRAPASDRAREEDIMRIRRVQRAAVLAASLAMAVGGTALASAATVQPALVRGGQPTGIQHVLLISVDGLHQQDLT
jgi:hypothetical protein